MSELVYCSYEGRPAVYVAGSGGVAWWFEDGAWKSAPGPEIATSAAVLSKAAFDERFGHLPALPEI